MKQIEEYKQMGFKLMPSGKINHNLWYIKKFGRCSVKDSTWCRKNKYHKCCKSKRAYCHLVGCINRIELLADDDYSDLK